MHRALLRKATFDKPHTRGLTTVKTVINVPGNYT